MNDTSEEEDQDARARLKDHANFARAAYQNNIDRVRSDIVYKSNFPFFN